LQFAFSVQRNCLNNYDNVYLICLLLQNKNQLVFFLCTAIILQTL